MRVFICLSIFSFVLATCQGKCFSGRLIPSRKDGKGMKPNTCIDLYDEKPHPIGSRWSTAHCYVCRCSQAGMRCCQREQEVILVERCKNGENPESYKHLDPGLDDKCRFIIPVDEDTIEIIRGRKSE